MLRHIQNNRGQGVVVQYATTFFLIIAVVTAMSIYVRRTIQARVHDARDFMLDTINKEVYQDPSQQLVGPLLVEYEPYYSVTESVRYTEGTETRKLLPSYPAPSGIFVLDLDQTSTLKSNQLQLSPENLK